MQKKNKLKIIISSVVTLMPMIFGILLWEQLPESIATNFGINGEVTGYSSKIVTVVVVPLLLFILNLVCVFATNADPKKKNINDKIITLIVSIVPACSLVCGFLIYSHALGYKINVETVMPVFIGTLILLLGFFLGNCKQNYTVGIKLPWTLNDEDNWDKTHKLAGKLWICGGALMILSGTFNLPALFFIILIVITLIPTVYSYLIYKKSK